MISLISKPHYLLSLLLATTFVSATLHAKDRADYWRETNLKVRSLEKIVANEVCFDDVETFVGCMAAVESLLARHSPKLEVVTAKGKALATFGKVAVVRDTRMAAVDEITLSLERERRWSDFYEKLEPSRRGSAVNFRGLLNYAKKHVLRKNKSNEAYFTAEAINSYFREAVDPHTRIFPRALYRELSAKGIEPLIGIGIVLRRLSERTLIQQVWEHTPAEAAGLLPGDELVSVNGVKTQTLPLDEVNAKLVGAENTEVEIEVARAGEIVARKLTRSKLVGKNVVGRLIEDRGIKIGYIKLHNFYDEKGCAKLEAAVRDHKLAGAKALVLDLRGNPGGLVKQSVCITSLFVAKGLPITALRYFDPSDGAGVVYNTSDEPVTDLPMVTLINEDSASASEIVAAALQDHHRSLVMGTRSFGKHTAQIVNDEPFDSNLGIMLLETRASFHRPALLDERQIGGVSPDIEVEAMVDPNDIRPKSLREEEQFPRALPAKARHLDGLTGPRHDAIVSCMATSDGALADLRYERGKDELQGADYQLLKAQDALFCMLTQSISPAP